MWLRGQATQSTILDKLTKLACGEVADDVGNTTPLADRWVRLDAGQDFIVSPASTKVALPAMNGRCGYFQPSNSHHPNAPTIRGAFYRVSSVATAAPTGVARWVIQCWCTTSNTVAGVYSNASIRYVVLNADTGAVVAGGGPTQVTPNAAGVFTASWTGGSCQITCGNSETGILVQTNQTFTGVGHYASFGRTFTSAYLGGIDFWPMEPKRFPGESSTFTVAPPGVAGTDYDKDVRVPTGFITGASSNRSNYLNAKGGYGYGLGIKTNTGLGGGALYTVSWNCFGMGVHLSLNGTQYVQAELFGSSGIRADGTGRTRIHGERITQWMRLFTGAPLSSSVVQYWLAVKADRLIIVLNADPGVGGVLCAAGVWRFTAADPTFDLFPWAATGPVMSYQADNGSNGAAFMPLRGVSAYAQLAAQTGDGLPASRDWFTGWMRTDIAMPTVSGQSGQNLTGTIFDGADDQTGIEMLGNAPADNITPNGAGYGGWSSTPADNNANLAKLGHPGAFGAMTNTIGGDQESTPTFPYSETKPAPGDTRWWLYGHVYTDTPSTGLYPNQKYRGRVDDGKFFMLPSTGWASGDELTDTATGKVYFCVYPDYAGNGFGKVRTNTNVFAVGLAIEEAA